MAQSDWTQLTDSLGTSILDRSPTNGPTPPNGGGSYTYAWNSIDSAVGAAGFYYSTDPGNFAPTAKGVRIRAAMRRLANSTGSTPFVYGCLQSSAVAGMGYLIGLAHDETPARLIVAKGAPSNGLLAANAIMQSSAYYNVGDWMHIQVDVIRQQGSDDVKLIVWENNLSAHTVGSPTFVKVPGMESFTDDSVGIATGSAPYLNGYVGFAHYSGGVGRYALHDHLQIWRQN
jgi:hypothetical protein